MTVKRPLAHAATLGILLYATSSPALAIADQEVSVYRDNTVGGVAVCLGQYELYLAEYELHLATLKLHASLARPPEKPSEPMEFRASADTDFSGCKESRLKATAAQYRSLIKTMHSKGRRDAVKGIQIAFVAAMNGLEARPGELEREYRRRQTDLRTRLDEAWARFDVEQ
ncbi:hypothetical protein PEC18_05995 [Paucibacter sp. O1-1]|nr:hypothetical protein [Paucibacter sp. O1-1]MDA3825422.1 hypothetical protein [Paucibacter sp. O1-1]